MNEPIGSSTPHTSVCAPGCDDLWCRRSTRLLLFFLHLVLLIAALSLTPSGHAFRLGAAVGPLLLVGCLFSWAVLFNARSRTLVRIFSGVAIAQIAFIAFVGWSFRSEDKALQALLADAARQQEEETAAMAPFSMEPLFEMSSGTRPLSQQELAELRLRARRGRAKVQEIELIHKRWVERMETQLGTVSLTATRDFHEGFVSSQPEANEIAKTLQDYFTETEQLAAFLMEHQNQYHQTPTGLVFDKSEGERAFNRRVDSIARLQDHLQETVGKAREKFNQLPH